MKIRDLLESGIERLGIINPEKEHSGLWDEFRKLEKEHKNHAKFKQLEKDFKKANNKFESGKSEDNDDVMHNAVIHMQAAIDDFVELV